MEIKDLLDIISYHKELFQNYDQLVISLKKLDNVIGMKKIKSQIVNQISNYILSNNIKEIKGSILKKGETSVGKIICEIWIAVGFKKEGEKLKEFKGIKKYGTF